MHENFLSGVNYINLHLQILSDGIGHFHTATNHQQPILIPVSSIKNIIFVLFVVDHIVIRRISQAERDTHTNMLVVS